MISVNSFHIELTNKCYLKCPRCARTTFIEKFGINKYKNYDLNFDHFQNFFDIDISNKKFIFCGNYGDPIYHPNLFQFIKFLKNKNSSVKIVTNGSYKTKIWWENLICMLDCKDSITFSIDGTSENFTQYRKNADWETIKIGLEIVGNSNIDSEWSYIPFNYNTNSIDDARDLSKSFGIKQFTISPSHRWEENDWLKPNKEYLSDLSEKKIEWKIGNRNIKIDPKCINGSEHYISAEGQYMPCCFVGDWRFYYKSEFYKNKEKYDISKTTLSKVIDITNTFYNNLHNYDYCKFSCPKV